MALYLGSLLLSEHYGLLQVLVNQFESEGLLPVPLLFELLLAADHGLEALILEVSDGDLPLKLSEPVLELSELGAQAVLVLVDLGESALVVLVLPGDLSDRMLLLLTPEDHSVFEVMGLVISVLGAL